MNRQKSNTHVTITTPILHRRAHDVEEAEIKRRARFPASIIVGDVTELQAGNETQVSSCGALNQFRLYRVVSATPIVDPPATAKEAYPISGLTFLLVPKDGSDVEQRRALRDFIEYTVTTGQDFSRKLGLCQTAQISSAE